jgi:hypothetical protein
MQSNVWNSLLGSEDSVRLADVLAADDAVPEFGLPAYAVLVAHKLFDAPDRNVTGADVRSALSIARKAASQSPIQCAELLLAVSRLTAWQTNHDHMDTLASLAMAALLRVPALRSNSVGPRCERKLDTPTEMVWINVELCNAECASALFMRALRRVYVYGGANMSTGTCESVATIVERFAVCDERQLNVEAAALLMSVLDAIDRDGGDASIFTRATQLAHSAGIAHLPRWQQPGWPIRAAITTRYLRLHRDYDANLVHVAPSVMASGVDTCDDADCAVIAMHELQHVLRRQLQAWWPTLLQHMRAGDTYAACALSVHHSASWRAEIIRWLLAAAPSTHRADRRAAGHAAAHAIELMSIRFGVRWYGLCIRVRNCAPPRKQAFELRIDDQDADLPVHHGGVRQFSVHRCVLRNSRYTQRWAGDAIETWYGSAGASIDLPADMSLAECRAVFELPGSAGRLHRRIGLRVRCGAIFRRGRSHAQMLRQHGGRHLHGWGQRGARPGRMRPRLLDGCGRQAMLGGAQGRTLAETHTRFII